MGRIGDAAKSIKNKIINAPSQIKDKLLNGSNKPKDAPIINLAKPQPSQPSQTSQSSSSPQSGSSQSGGSGRTSSGYFRPLPPKEVEKAKSDGRRIIERGNPSNVIAPQEMPTEERGNLMILSEGEAAKLRETPAGTQKAEMAVVVKDKTSPIDAIDIGKETSIQGRGLTRTGGGRGVSYAQEELNARAAAKNVELFTSTSKDFRMNPESFEGQRGITKEATPEGITFTMTNQYYEDKVFRPQELTLLEETRGAALKSEYALGVTRGVKGLTLGTAEFSLNAFSRVSNKEGKFEDIKIPQTESMKSLDRLEFGTVGKIGVATPYIFGGAIITKSIIQGGVQVIKTQSFKPVTEGLRTVANVGSPIRLADQTYYIDINKFKVNEFRGTLIQDNSGQRLISGTGGKGYKIIDKQFKDPSYTEFQTFNVRGGMERGVSTTYFSTPAVSINKGRVTFGNILGESSANYQTLASEGGKRVFGLTSKNNYFITILKNPIRMGGNVKVLDKTYFADINNIKTNKLNGGLIDSNKLISGTGANKGKGGGIFIQTAETKPLASSETVFRSVSGNQYFIYQEKGVEQGFLLSGKGKVTIGYGGGQLTSQSGPRSEFRAGGIKDIKISDGRISSLYKQNVAGVEYTYRSEGEVGTKILGGGGKTKTDLGTLTNLKSSTTTSTLTSIQAPKSVESFKVLPVFKTNTAQQFRTTTATYSMTSQRLITPSSSQLVTPTQTPTNIFRVPTIVGGASGVGYKVPTIESPRQALESPQAFKSPTPTSTRTTIGDSNFDFPGLPFILFPKKLYFDDEMRTRKIPKGKRRYRYTPSFEALILNIRGKQPKGVETGLRLRPIPKGFKWSFNRRMF